MNRVNQVTYLLLTQGLKPNYVIFCGHDRYNIIFKSPIPARHIVEVEKTGVSVLYISTSTEGEEICLHCLYARRRDRLDHIRKTYSEKHNRLTYTKLACM